MWNLKHNTNELIYETETDSHWIFPVTQRWSWQGHWNLTLQDLILVCALTEMCDVTKRESEPSNISPTYFGQLSFGDAPWSLPIQKATHRDLDNLWPQSISKWRQSKLSRQMQENIPQGTCGERGVWGSSPPMSDNILLIIQIQPWAPFLLIFPHPNLQWEKFCLSHERKSWNN